jgi:hypothetical protein
MTITEWNNMTVAESKQKQNITDKSRQEQDQCKTWHALGTSDINPISPHLSPVSKWPPGLQYDPAPCDPFRLPNKNRRDWESTTQTDTPTLGRVVALDGADRPREPRTNKPPSTAPAAATPANIKALEIVDVWDDWDMLCFAIAIRQTPANVK